MKTLLFILFTIISVLTVAQQFNLNDRVEAEDQGKWYKATVIRAKGGQHYKDGKYFIHWDGYAASYDVWIEEAKLRKPGSGTNSSTASSASQATKTNTPPAEAKFKEGDKVTYIDDHFCNGTITGYKNGMYLVDFPDQWLNAQGKQGVSEKSIVPQWTYKEFFDELKALIKIEYKNSGDYTYSKIYDLAKMVCGDCGGGSSYYGQTDDYIRRAKKDMEELKALVKKYQPLPDTKNKMFYLNPAVTEKISVKGDSVIAALQSYAFNDRMRRWFDADMYFYDFTQTTNSTEHVLFNGRSFADFAVCGSLSELKAGLTKNLQEAIKVHGLAGTPEEYLKGFDENFEKRKTKLIADAEKNSWVKSDYPHLDNSMNALVANANLKTLNTYFNVTSFQVKKDDYGYITEQTKGGVVIYQKPGCNYWMWQYITIYKPYLGNGKYGPAKARFMDYGFIKPF